ncbi:carbonic anhydrase [Vararia minispora EC-137]|uniref:Carbonic anhydrase n=1 Tax=Vararia minispora EC-137 TaxID=1314806 RepID=A0ACB8QWQ0_9AGAM|nr:carbonic anhydrase [Vararia minispora EC-137]
MDNHLKHLLSSNATWANAVSAADLDFFRTSAKNPQRPRFLWIGCADSRVPESVITASRPGDIFTHRNIANQVLPDDNSVHAVLMHAIGNNRDDPDGDDVVGEPRDDKDDKPEDPDPRANYIEHILVVGHSDCAGVTAAYNALQPKNPSVPADSLTRWLAPLTALALSLGIGNVQPPKDAITLLVEENVKAQVANTDASAAVKKAREEGRRVWIHGLVYDVGSGKLRDLGVSVGPGNC